MSRLRSYQLFQGTITVILRDSAVICGGYLPSSFIYYRHKYKDGKTLAEYWEDFVKVFVFDAERLYKNRWLERTFQFKPGTNFTPYFLTKESSPVTKYPRDFYAGYRADYNNREVQELLWGRFSKDPRDVLSDADHWAHWLYKGW